MSVEPPIRVVSLYCGCGGFDLGARGGFVFMGRRFAKLPTRTALAVDSDPAACALYRQNLGPVECARVEDTRAWPRSDLVIAGPPCQPFSAAGAKRGRNDERNALPGLANAIRAMRPDVALVENVPGLIERVAGRPALDDFLRAMRNEGYIESMAVIDAADFGAPSHRRRLFIALVRDASPFVFPAPTHGPGSDRPHVTVRDAIADLHAPFHDRDFRTLREGERRHPKFGASSRRVIADEPFPTIKAADSASRRLIHPWFDRFLTMPELLRAQSFPDDFIVPKRSGAIGNAVPPVLAWALVRTLVRHIRPKNHKF